MTTMVLGGPDAASALAQASPPFAPLVERFGPARVEAPGRPFHALVSAVAQQQVSKQAGGAILGRVEELLGPEPTPERVLEVGAEALRGCGLSATKATTVTELARRDQRGELGLDRLHELEDQTVVERLTCVKGIGPWTVHMLLIFDQGRPDVLAATDLGVQDGARRLLALEERPTPAALTRLAEPWRPYRSLACWYLWRERDRQLQDEGRR